jgi:ribosomal protein S18 acetylase RimI-like enzyme
MMKVSLWSLTIGSGGENMNIFHEQPNVEAFLSLRRAAGREETDIVAAERAISRSLFSVVVRNDEEETIGMGRVVGDGGCYFQIVDIAVSPSHQGQGLDEVIVREMIGYLERNALQGADVMVMSDVPSIGLYKKFGFDLTYPNSLSMIRKL